MYNDPMFAYVCILLPIHDGLNANTQHILHIIIIIRVNYGPRIINKLIYREFSGIFERDYNV